MTIVAPGFWVIAAAGWVLFVGATYLWRRAIALAEDEKVRLNVAIRILAEKADQAENRSLSIWLAKEAPDGLEIQYMSGPIPVEAEGKIDGFDFYFRARGNHWTFTVANPDDPASLKGSMWSIQRQYGDEEFAASYMPQIDALGLILQCAKQFRNECPQAVISPSQSS